MLFRAMRKQMMSGSSSTVLTILFAVETIDCAFPTFLNAQLNSVCFKKTPAELEPYEITDENSFASERMMVSFSTFVIILPINYKMVRSIGTNQFTINGDNNKKLTMD